jgi:hypothetical protein
VSDPRVSATARRQKQPSGAAGRTMPTASAITSAINDDHDEGRDGHQDLPRPVTLLRHRRLRSMPRSWHAAGRVASHGAPRLEKETTRSLRDGQSRCRRLRSYSQAPRAAMIMITPPTILTTLPCAVARIAKPSKASEVTVAATASTGSAQDSSSCGGNEGRAQSCSGVRSGCGPNGRDDVAVPCLLHRRVRVWQGRRRKRS